MCLHSVSFGCIWCCVVNCWCWWTLVAYLLVCPTFVPHCFPHYWIEFSTCDRWINNNNNNNIIHSFNINTTFTWIDQVNPIGEHVYIQSNYRLIYYHHNHNHHLRRYIIIFCVNFVYLKLTLNWHHTRVYVRVSVRVYVYVCVRVCHQHLAFNLIMTFHSF